MGKSVSNDVLDGAFNILIGAANKMTACSQEPTSYNQANNTYALADAPIASSDFALSDGVTSGRRVTVAAKADIDVDADGTATHVALLDTSSNRLLYVTTCAAQGLTSGSTVSFSSWDIEIQDPV